ncbi:MAG: PAS domain S-box protein [Candidatus Binatia bacterium]
MATADQKKTKAQLIVELEHLRERLATLETAQTFHQPSKQSVQRQAEEERDRFFKLSLDLLAISNLDGHFERVNPAWERTLGFSLEELQSRPFLEFVHPEDRDATCVALQQLASGIDLSHFENRYRCKDGSYRWLSWKTTAPFPGQRTLYNVVRDVTEQKATEAMVRATQEIFAGFMENNPAIAFIKDNAGRYVYLNDPFVHLLGDQEREWIGKTDYEIWPEVAEQLTTNDCAVLVSGTPVQFQERIKIQGDERYFISFKFPLRGPAGQTLLGGLSVDVTEQKKMEESIRQQDILFRALAEATPTAVCIYQEERFVYLNSATLTLSGYTREELLTMNAFAFVHPAFRGATKEHIIRHLQNSRITPAYEGKILRKDGEERWVMYTGSLVEFAGKPALLLTTFDITDQKKAEGERTKLQEQLFQSQKLEALGKLAGGIAHDFNNLLAPILGFTELTMQRLLGESEEYGNLHEVMLAGQRAKHLVKQILSFGRPHSRAHVSLPLDHVVQETLSLLRASLPTTIVIQYHNDDPSACVWADPTQMQQLLTNLCVNAKQAMREKGGVLEILVAPLQINGETLRQTEGLAAGSFVRLTVRDTGCGMSPDLLKKIFDPFFTTRPVGEGSGLGLAIVHSIVSSHGGLISVDSTPGAGTTFHIDFPRIADVASRANDAKATVRRGKGCILFVDDEEMVVRVGQRMLERCGYAVISATNASDALALFRHDPLSFTAVVTDQTMPDMTGQAFAKELLRLRPDLPILLCTGFSETWEVEQAKALGVREFLMKPLSLEELSAALARMTGSQTVEEDVQDAHRFGEI